MAQIILKKLTKKFGDFTAVNTVNLNINDKQFVCLLGPSGSGKTTILRMIAGLENPTEGEIYIGDEVVNALRTEERDIAMVFQFYALYPTLTVYDNLAFPLKAQKMSKQEIKEAVKETAEILKIADILHKKPKQLTSSEAQRAALGRAIIRKPKVYLLDEPLTNLDAKMRVLMRAELKRLHEQLKQTAIYVTHDQIEAMSMAEKVAILHQGRLQQYDSPEGIYHKPKNLFVASFIGSPPMNFFDCSLLQRKEKIFLDSGEFQVDISEYSENVRNQQSGDEMILGVRPEDLIVNKKGEKLFDTEIYMTEFSGEEIQLSLNYKKDVIISLVSPDLQFKVGEKVSVSFDKSKIYLFNKKDEKAIL